jgi:hypothetical protein
MSRKPPIPICKAFLTCRQAIPDPKYHDLNLFGLRSYSHHHRYPAAVNVGIFARLTSAHGEYQLEIQVQSPEGEVVWKEGPPEPWTLDDPLKNYDLRFNITLVFPKPALYELVLLGNGEEIARERFNAKLTQEVAEKG